MRWSGHVRAKALYSSSPSFLENPAWPELWLGAADCSVREAGSILVSDKKSQNFDYFCHRIRFVKFGGEREGSVTSI
jgi:hypothetical protein